MRKLMVGQKYLRRKAWSNKKITGFIQKVNFTQQNPGQTKDYATPNYWKKWNYKVSVFVKVKVKIVGASIHIHWDNNIYSKFHVVGNTALEVHRDL